MAVHGWLRIAVCPPVADQLRLHGHLVRQHEVTPAIAVGTRHLAGDLRVAVIHSPEMVEQQLQLVFLVLRAEAVAVLSGRFTVNLWHRVSNATCELV